MSHTDASGSALNHDLLQQAQSHLEKTAAPSAQVSRIANALAARAADVTKTFNGLYKPVATASAALPTPAALPKATHPVTRISDALSARADEVGKQMSSLYKPGVKTSAYSAQAAWTPQQFGLLVGNYTGKQSAANPVDAHGTSFIPVVGGAISGAVKQHPGLGSVNSTAREGLAGIGGGITGGMAGAGLGAGAAALGNILTRGKLGFRSNIAGGLAGALAGSSAGTHMAAQTSRENVPMNARALFAASKQAGQPNTKQAFLGAAGRAIGGAVSGAVNAAKPMVSNAMRSAGNALATPAGQTFAPLAAGVGAGAAMIPVAQHLENKRIDAQVDRQRARAMQQPKPQMATGMPQAPAPQLNKAALLLGPQNDPLSKALGVSGGVGGMMRNINSASKTLANTSIDPARAQQLQAQQGPRVPSGPGGGLLMPGATFASRKTQAPSPNSTGMFGGPMSTAPMAPSPNSTGTFGGAGAGTGQGGIMGGGGPLSMAMAGKQSSLVPNAFQATAKGVQQRSALLQELLGNLQPLSGRKGLDAVGSAFKPERYSGNYGRGLTAQHLNKMTTDASQQLGQAGDKLENLQALFPGKR